MHNIRPIAIYLPQFYPTPENNEWWGKGFTEWTNVVKAKPRFRGHYQPHLPADLGFYDLRLAEARQAQADLARQYGIHGFCYYHYWFNGRRILERPFEEIFHSGSPDFPFMLCWANENWTRIWNGGVKDVLLEQTYSREDAIAHINTLIPYFQDKRYIRVQGRPVFAIYRDKPTPEFEETVRIFREECAKQGIDLYICKFVAYSGAVGFEKSKARFDAEIEFAPFSHSINQFRLPTPKIRLPKYIDPKKYWAYLKTRVYYGMMQGDLKISYEKYSRFDVAFDASKKNLKIFPGVSPSWDNSARRTKRGATIYYGSTPDLFREWVAGKVANFQPFGEDENFLFVNAWNEWAEGNHLEPCQKWGHGYLQALQDGLRG